MSTGATYAGIPHLECHTHGTAWAAALLILGRWAMRRPKERDGQCSDTRAFYYAFFKSSFLMPESGVAGKKYGGTMRKKRGFFVVACCCIAVVFVLNPIIVSR